MQSIPAPVYNAMQFNLIPAISHTSIVLGYQGIVDDTMIKTNKNIFNCKLISVLYEVENKLLTWNLRAYYII